MYFKRAIFLCVCFSMFIIGISTSAMASSEPIKKEWLNEQVYFLPVDHDVRYSIYIKSMTQGGEAIILNSHKMPSASLIKIPILIEAFHQKNQGKLDFDEKIVIRHEDTVEGGSVYLLPDQSVLTVRELLTLMIVQSDNSATNIIIDKIGMKNINKMIQKQGLKDTSLQRKMMDFKAVEEGRQNYTSVADMGKLFEKLYKKQCLDPKSDAEMIEILKWQEDNLVIPAQIPRPVQVAHKTGELDGIYHDCGIVYGQSNIYIIGIMCENIKNEPQALFDMSTISLAIYDKVGR